jgi:hypothetical protein
MFTQHIHRKANLKMSETRFILCIAMQACKLDSNLRKKEKASENSYLPHTCCGIEADLLEFIYLIIYTLLRHLSSQVGINNFSVL